MFARFCAENPNKLDDVYSVAWLKCMFEIDVHAEWSCMLQVEKKPLGEGSYGQVCKGVHKDTGAVRAIKAVVLILSIDLT